MKKKYPYSSLLPLLTDDGTILSFPEGKQGEKEIVENLFEIRLQPRDDSVW